MDQITGFSTSLGTYHNMPWNKRAHTGNLGELVKKKAQPKSSESNDDEAEILSSTSLMEQSQPPYNWETGGIKNTCDDRVTVETEIESILSLLSDDEDVLELVGLNVDDFNFKVAERLLNEHGDVIFLNRCSKCDKLARTPWAKQCRHCGYDWH